MRDIFVNCHIVGEGFYVCGQALNLGCGCARGPRLFCVPRPSCVPYLVVAFFYPVLLGATAGDQHGCCADGEECPTGEQAGESCTGAWEVRGVAGAGVVAGT